MKPVERLWNTILSSYPLVILSEDRKILRSMSGAMVNYRDANWLITVCEGNPGSTIMIYSGHSGTTGIYNPVNDFAAIEIEGVKSPEGVSLFFAVARIDDTVLCHYQEMDAHGTLLSEKERRILPLVRDNAPNLADRYSFAFLADRNEDPDRFDHSVQVVEDLELNGKTGNLFRFQTTRKSGNFQYNPGCEGAPLLNEDGDLVSLLVGVQSAKGRAAGPHSGEFIFGIDLWAYLGR